jgi:hypothetical protein
VLASCREQGGYLTMHELALVERDGRADDYCAEQISEPLNLYKTILQTEREQMADAARIDDAVTNAENDIARLERRRLARRELHDMVIAVRDRTILIIRDVRKNMETRAFAAQRMQACLNGEFLRLRSRFAAADLADRNLRSQLMERLERTPTSALTDRLRDAAQAGNAACAELIRFEFRCGDDRREFMARFEAVAAKLASNDPVEMRRRIAGIRKAIERADARVTGLRERVRLACAAEEGAAPPPGQNPARA